MKGTLEERFYDKVEITQESECWLWTAAQMGSGYGMMQGPGHRMWGAHRLSYLIHFGECPDDLLVCHHCDVKLCVNPDHLFLGTTQDNINDKVNKGRARGGGGDQRGTKNNNAKVTLQQVEAVKAMYAKGIAQREIARQTGVHYGNVWCIVHGKSWVGFDSAAPRVIADFSAGRI